MEVIFFFIHFKKPNSTTHNEDAKLDPSNVPWEISEWVWNFPRELKLMNCPVSLGNGALEASNAHWDELRARNVWQSFSIYNFYFHDFRCCVVPFHNCCQCYVTAKSTLSALLLIKVTANSLEFFVHKVLSCYNRHLLSQKVHKLFYFDPIIFTTCLPRFEMS